ncbi:hypothetical protein P8C59_002868 [Phyllachora maydis]|uniref:Secreted protein n=1 Tax=Phyllachora maydis TaxID=1825666 RepID=A0AAD9I0N9_9PEZI|nr:hypothetical protein P8C59_002868 [Phyllachora maydis]
MQMLSLCVALHALAVACIPTLGDSKFVSKISFRTRQNISASVNSGQTIGRGLPPLGRPEARGLHPQRLALLG